MRSVTGATTPAWNAGAVRGKDTRAAGFIPAGLAADVAFCEQCHRNRYLSGGWPVRRHGPRASLTTAGPLLNCGSHDPGNEPAQPRHPAPGGRDLYDHRRAGRFAPAVEEA